MSSLRCSGRAHRAAVLRPAWRRRERRPRYSKTFDLSGVARDHALDALAAALAAAGRHRAASRRRSPPEGPGAVKRTGCAIGPAALGRLLEEVAAAGRRAGDPRRRLAAAGARARAERRARRSARPRRRAARRRSRPRRCATRSSSSPAGSPACSSSVPRTIRSARSISPACTTSGRTAPSRSRELLDRGYEDAYRQFIEPVVGAGGRADRSGPTASMAAPAGTRVGRATVIRMKLSDPDSMNQR